MVASSASRPLPTPGLYYPYADFQSEAWVKLAVINWSRIERIKPARYPHEDQMITRRLFELGWLQDITPDRTQLMAAAQEFLFEFLLTPNQPSFSGGFRLDQRKWAKYAVEQRSAWPETHFGIPPHGADKRLAYVYAGSGDEMKMIPWLIQYLKRARLVLRHEVNGAIWLGLHPYIAGIYMCALTRVIADDRLLVPVTDDEIAHRAFGRSALDRLGETLGGGRGAPREIFPEEIESQYVEIALRGALNPVDLDEIPIEKIIEFRGTHEAELRAFQDHVFGLREEVLKVSQIGDTREIEHRLRDLYKSRTEPELRDLQEKLRRFGIRSVPGFFGLRIDKDSAIQIIGGAAAAAGAHYVLGPAAPVAVPFAISVAAIPYIRTRHKEHWRIKHESPASLLLAAKHELAPKLENLG